MEFYCVINNENKYFRSKGRNRSGEAWVSDITDARFYTKIGKARSIVTFFAKYYPRFGIPNIIKFIADKKEIINEDDRIKKILIDKLEKDKRILLRLKEQELIKAKIDYKKAKDNLDNLNKYRS